MHPYDIEEWWQGDSSRRWFRGELSFEESYEAVRNRELREQAERILPELDIWVKQGRISPFDARAFRQYLETPEEKVIQQWQEREDERRDENGRVRRPWLWDDPRYKIPNQPVVGVCWYEVQAYAAWLTNMMRAADILLPGSIVRLPSEAEWEKAARGTDSRRWPWGNRWDMQRANTLEGRVYFPSPVGAYPRGASPYGALDMAGNVWKWCLDWYDQQEYKNRQGSPVVDPTGPQSGEARVVRGGAWSYNRNDARCAYRNGDVPDGFNYYIRFRLVCSPSLSQFWEREGVGG